MKDRMDEIRSTASPRLREDQIEVLMRYGETRKTVAGQVLPRAGDASLDFIVVLEGALEVVDDFAGEARIIVIQRAGGFVGELNMLTGQARYVSVMVREGGEVLTIPSERMKEVVTEESNLSDIILKALLARRSWEMRNGGTGLRLVGSRRSRDAARLREFAARNRLPHVWIELEDDPNAEALLERFGAKPSETPVAIWQGKDVLKNPTNAELAQAIGLTVDPPRKQTYDPGRSRDRACGPRRGGLRSFGGPLHPRPRVDSPGRAGWHQFSDRELPGLPRGSLGLRAR